MNCSKKFIDMRTMENVESINYLRQKIDVIQKSLSDIGLSKPEEPHEDKLVSSKSSSSSTGSEISSSNSDRPDSIKSCESILKIFCFEPREFNKKNKKCLDFWNLINDHPEIQPVNCVIMDAQNNKRDDENQTDKIESENSLWIRALYELRKKKLHHVAVVTAGNPCRFCKEPADSYEVSDDDHLSELNSFEPVCSTLFGNLNTLKSGAQRVKGKKPKEKDSVNKPPVRKDLPGDANISVTEERTEEGSNYSTVKNVSEITVDDVIQLLEDKVESVILKKGDSESEYHSTLKNISEVTVQETPNPELPTKKDHSLVNTELVKNLSVALQSLEQQNKVKASETKVSEESSGKLSVSVKGSASIKGIMDNWKKPPSGTFKKVEQKVSIGHIQVLYDNEDYSGESNESIGNSKKAASSDITRPQTNHAESQRRRDNYTYVQHTLSLLHIDINDYDTATAKQRKKLLQDALKESYSKFVKHDPEGTITPPCPCDKQLQKQTNSSCTCEPGVCKITKELEVEDLKELTKYMPYSPGLECMKLMIEGLKEIRKKELTIEETSAKVQELLKSIQDRTIQDGPCLCPLHQIDMNAIDEQLKDARFAKELISDRFDETVNWKYGRKLGIECHGKHRSEAVQFDGDIEEQSAKASSSKVKKICILCEREKCRCGHSKYKVIHE